MAEQIYIAPNVRTQTLEDAEEFISAKRVARLIMAQKHSQTILDKALILQDKTGKKFARQEQLFINSMQKMVTLIEGMETRLQTMAQLHEELVNIEQVIDDAK